MDKIMSKYDNDTECKETLEVNRISRLNDVFKAAKLSNEERSQYEDTDRHLRTKIKGQTLLNV